MNCGFSQKKNQPKTKKTPPTKKNPKQKTPQIGFSVFYLLWLSQDHNSHKLFLMMQKKTLIKFSF